MQAMLEAALDPERMKKFKAAVLASIGAAACKAAGFDDNTTLLVISPLLAFIPSQGLADFGKERAYAQAAAGVTAAELSKPKP